MQLKQRFKRVDIQASMICVCLVICSCMAIFVIDYKMTYDDIIKTLRERTDAIYNAMDNLVYADLFDQINNASDMDDQLYQEYQERMLQMREVSNVRYLYTAKLNDQGEYVYVIDGLPLDSSDFRKPGELIEEDIISDISRAYQGEIVSPNEILNTSWGKIFLAYYPIHGGEGHTDDIMGVVGIEIDAETQYHTYSDMTKRMPLIIITSCVVAFLVFRWCFRYISNPRRKDLYNIDILTDLKNRASFDYDVHSVYARISDISVIMIDLDRLKRINDKFGHGYGDEYIQLAAKALKAGIGKNGVGYRMGGDEFVCVINTANKKQILEIIENIKKEFVNLSKNFHGDIGLSIGYAIFDAEKDKDLKSTVKRADAFMYQEKRDKYN